MMPDLPPPAVYLPVPVTMPAPVPVQPVRYLPTVTYLINGQWVVVQQGQPVPVVQQVYQPVPTVMAQPVQPGPVIGAVQNVIQGVPGLFCPPGALR